MSAGGTLSIKNAHADGFGSSFLQSLDLAETDKRRKFVALPYDALGGACAALHGPMDDVLGEFF